MPPVAFDPGTFEAEEQDWWTRWKDRALAATKDLIEAWERSKTGAGGEAQAITFKSAIWTELKSHLLLKLFGGKCAYCETKKSVRWPVDVEHFRPKGAVEFRVDDERLKRATAEDENGHPIEHPGYFWLAYNWKNLLPSCKRCNSGKGKNMQFPVERAHVFLKRLSATEARKLKAPPIESPNWKGMYYLAPEDLDDLESPLLLNPYRDDPANHIRFGIKGIEAAVDQKGEYTIRVLDLADDELRRERQRAQEQGLFSVFARAQYHSLQGDTLERSFQKAQKEVEDTRATMEYSAAVLDALPALWMQLTPRPL